MIALDQRGTGTSRSVRYRCRAIPRAGRDGGRGFALDADGTVASRRALCGGHGDDWTAVSCPTPPVRGTESDEPAAGHARHVAARRGAGARLVELTAGHVVHHDAPSRSAAEVDRFLSEPA
ncbi:hypothetical protein WDV06_27230 [Streptomyces racemochromogenes]|uniref:Alpha/beta hydrolase n=1 Tax=Streptomyces racemochromogenes TaxID=67353 RepID=A0ABW7PK25_9ACTN